MLESTSSLDALLGSVERSAGLAFELSVATPELLLPVVVVLDYAPSVALLLRIKNQHTNST